MESMNGQLALFGGLKVVTEDFIPYNTIGEDEIAAATGVLKSGNLSQFLGSWGPNFFGGPMVAKFEDACASFFQTKHAITVNSWTSGLVAAVGAVGISPGDEVIVPSWTMSASATAILHWNGIPVFADIDANSFCVDVRSIEKLITKRTVAIITVDIFGQSANILQIVELAHSRGIKVICDSAQAPGAKAGEKYAGTLGDIGGISLNYHKHTHTGEGGVLFTDDDELADRMRLIRNHGEVVVGSRGDVRLDNMVGHNFRLGEIESAIGIEQLRKLPALTEQRATVAEQLSHGLAALPDLRLPKVSWGNTHVYYAYGMVLEGKALEVGRAAIIAALEAEGVTGLMNGYQNIHMLPVYQKKIAFGRDGFPWNSPYCDNNVNYDKGICPLSEELHDSSFLGLQLCLFEYGFHEVEMVIAAFHKVWLNLDALSGYSH